MIPIDVDQSSQAAHWALLHSAMSGPYDGFDPYHLYYQAQPGGFVPPGDSYTSTYGLPQPTGHDYLNQPYTPVEEYASTYVSGQPSTRGRRRVGATGELVKHRRTRSGCYTCRNRRVKVSLLAPRSGSRADHTEVRRSATDLRS